GSKGGLLLCWSNNVSVLEIVNNFFSLEVKFVLNGRNDIMWGVFVYASVDDSERQYQWDLLLRHSLRWGELWFIGGDFNDIICNEEKKGGLVRGEGSFRDFRNFLQSLGVIECPLIGHQFTWSNLRRGEEFVEEKLDRICVSPEWWFKFPKTQIQNIPLASSDHNLLLMDLARSEEASKPRFMFDNRWTKKEGYKECISNAWKVAHKGPDLYRFQKKLRSVSTALLGWAVRQKTNSAHMINVCNAKLEVLSRQGGGRNWEEWQECKEKLHEAYREEELYWKQKSRVSWLKEGDKNTRFFQACVRQRRQRNNLDYLICRNGVQCKNRSEAVKEVEDFFTTLLKSKNHDSDPNQAQLILHILNCYCAASGQSVNLHKSSIFFSKNTPDSLKMSICNIFPGIAVAKYSKYLGLPLGIGRSNKDTFSFVK
ncbi:Unknown protein, partial [Striga hermonthica]